MSSSVKSEGSLLKDPRRLKEVIAAWLELTKDHVPPGGLEREEALSRARELRRLLRERGPDGVELAIEEDTKDVLYALVELLTESRDGSPESRVREATDVYELIRSFPWVQDEFGEKRRLLKKSKELGAVPRRGRIPKRAAPSLEQRITWTFNDTRPFIRLLLLAKGGMTENEAAETEGILEVWFRRYCQRESGIAAERRAVLVEAAWGMAQEQGRRREEPGKGGDDDRRGRLLELRPAGALRRRNSSRRGRRSRSR